MRCWLLMAILLASPSQGLAAEVIPFQSFEQGGIGVPVFVNGAGPFIFLMDTGATHSSVSGRVVSKGRLELVAKTTVTTPAGDELRAVVHVPHLRIGSIAAHGLLPSVVEHDALDASGSIDGIIGQDVLADLRYTIDYKRREIRWLDDEVLHDRRAAISLIRIGGRFLLELPFGNTVIRLVPDSGSGGLVLFDQAAGTARTMSRGRSTQVELWAGRLRQPVEAITLRELTIGPHRLKDVPAYLLVQKAATMVAGDGLLPLHLFQTVTFDGPARRLWAE